MILEEQELIVIVLFLLGFDLKTNSTNSKRNLCRRIVEL